MDDECITCGEPDENGLPYPAECGSSKRPCGHHCNCSWIHDCCHWCNTEFGDLSDDGVT